MFCLQFARLKKHKTKQQPLMGFLKGISIVVKTNKWKKLARCFSSQLSSSDFWKAHSNQRIPRNYWKSTDNQTKYFDWLGKKIGIKQLDDWYEKLSSQLMAQNFGGTLLCKIHKGSPTAALITAYPEHNWCMWKFNTVADGFWKSTENKQKYFDWLGSKIGIKQPDDWYEKLSIAVIQQNHGGSLLTMHGSPLVALMAAYPDHNWIPWRFKRVPVGYWKSKDNVSRFLSELSDKLSIQTLDDWYRVDYKQLEGFSSVIREKGLYKFFKEQYPHHPWDPKKFQQKGKKAQRWLAVTLQKMFPDNEILEDYMHPQIKHPSSGRALQLDVFIPSQNLAFEYQGIQHYEDVHLFGPSKTIQERDEEKRTLCAANNIKLVEVPYWWNRTPEELHKFIGKSGALL